MESEAVGNTNARFELQSNLSKQLKQKMELNCQLSKIFQFKNQLIFLGFFRFFSSVVQFFVEINNFDFLLSEVNN